MGKFVVLLALLGLASLCLAQTTLLSDMKLIIKDEPLPPVGPIEPAIAPVLVNSKVNAQALLKDYKRPIVKEVENQKLKAPGNASFIQFPSQYKLTAYLELPYASLVEPVSFFYDGVGMQQRIEYYDGTDVYGAQALQHNGLSWSSNPVINQLQCFFSWDNLPTGAPPQSMLTPFIPDLTGFSVLQQQVSVNGQDCWQLQSVVQAGDQGEVVNTYNLYVTSSEPYVPILYDMLGYDSLLHSHYDHYIVSYTSFEANPTFPANIFSVPTNLGACANQTNPSGPSIAYNDPTAQYRFLFPSNSVSGDLSPEYKQFTSVYGRTSGSDSFIRQRIFHNNNAFISAHNRQHKLGIHSYSVKLNHLADWNEHEMRALRGKLYSENAPAPNTHKVSGAALPINVDWRFRGAVSEVQDQAVCGSCWSFGSTGTITGTYAIKTGLLIDFSQQQLMDCSWNFGNNACNGGEDFLAYEYIMQAGGLQAMVDYGAYKGQDGFCTPNPNPTIKPAVIQSYVNLTGTEALLDAIYSQGPISVSINASPKSFSFYHSGVYANTDPSSPCPGGAQNLDHSVLAVGYGVENGQQYYLVKNSWSTYWGDEGYIKISTALDTCGVADMPTYVQLSL